jgi:hypothetical protein
MDPISPLSAGFARRFFMKARHPALALASVLALAGVPALAGCGPRMAPFEPGTGSAGKGPRHASRDAAQAAPGAAVRPGAREVLVGEMCPGGAAGGPGVLPMFVRAATWSAGAKEVSAPVARRSVRQLSVMAWDGRRAGIFSVAGTANAGLERDVAVGAYAGASPCAGPASDSGREMDSACVDAQAHCGLALGVLEPGGGPGARPFDEEPDPAALPVGGACLAGDHLLVDIDGDAVLEAYPAAAFVDPGRAPADEVMAVPRSAATCEPAFAWRHVIPPGHAGDWRGMDLLGVVDIDGDGRRELIMSYHHARRRTWAVYSALSSSGRLDLVGEAAPWPTR